MRECILRFENPFSDVPRTESGISVCSASETKRRGTFATFAIFVEHANNYAYLGSVVSYRRLISPMRGYYQLPTKSYTHKLCGAHSRILDPSEPKW